MKILVLNCGSSSIKYQLIDMSKEYELLSKGLLDRIGLESSLLTHQVPGKNKYQTTQLSPIIRSASTSSSVPLRILNLA